MKTFTLILATTLALSSAKAQYTQDFEGGLSSTACWTMTDVNQAMLSPAQEVCTQILLHPVVLHVTWFLQH
jgi:hypothetical protein